MLLGWGQPDVTGKHRVQPMSRVKQAGLNFCEGQTNVTLKSKVEQAFVKLMCSKCLGTVQYNGPPCTKGKNYAL
jgi:hypothetical protein